jgi:hypothetical protein
MVSSRLSIRPLASDNNSGTTFKDVAKKEKFLTVGKQQKRPEPKYVIRRSLILKYKGVVDNYRAKSIYMQLFPLMRELMENYDGLTVGELIALYRSRQLNMDKPHPTEINKIKKHIAKLRNWLGKAAIVIYSERKEIPGLEKYGKQTIYEPIHNQTQYRKIVGKHMNKIISGIFDRDKQNEDNIDKNWREIQESLNMKMLEVDQTGKFLEIRRRKRSIKK